MLEALKLRTRRVWVEYDNIVILNDYMRYVYGMKWIRNGNKNRNWKTALFWNM